MHIARLVQGATDVLLSLAASSIPATAAEMDLDGDGKSGVRTGQNWRMLMDGFTIREVRTFFIEPATDWRIVGRVDPYNPRDFWILVPDGRELEASPPAGTGDGRRQRSHP